VTKAKTCSMLCDECEMRPCITSFSSAILSAGRKERDIVDRGSFECSVCDRKRTIGRDEDVFVRMEILNKRKKKTMICGRCVDEMLMVVRYGPQMLTDGMKLNGKIAGMSVVRGKMSCSCCRKKAGSHLFMKYDDLRVGGNRESYLSKTVCVNCVISAFAMVRKASVKNVRYVRLSDG
jgi:hypothetical protein